MSNASDFNTSLSKIENTFTTNHDKYIATQEKQKLLQLKQNMFLLKMN